LDRFEVWGADYDLASYCEGCPSDPRKLGDVFLEAPAPGLEIAAGPYTWSARLRPGRAHVLRVAGFSPRGAPGAWSETVVYALEPPGPLRGFSAEADDLSVVLSAPRPGGDLEVEIERSEAGGPFERLDPARVGGIDTGVSYGRSYAYRARLVRVRGDSRVPGPWTAATRLDIEDALPPPPPGHLDAAMAPEGARLVWESLAERGDVAGYRVYRDDGSGFAALGGLVEGNSWIDASAVPGRPYRYRVTAVDDSPRANESAPSPEASLTIERPEEAAPPARPEAIDPGI
jgi:hypothetical protein